MGRGGRNSLKRVASDHRVSVEKRTARRTGDSDGLPLAADEAFIKGSAIVKAETGKPGVLEYQWSKIS